jgi:hypothetical protein
MTSTLLLSLTTCMATMASAGEPRSEITEMRTCWYDENGTLTGSEPAADDAIVGSKNQVASSGAHTWKYTAAGADEVACPAKLPVSTISRHT